MTCLNRMENTKSAEIRHLRHYAHNIFHGTDSQNTHSVDICTEFGPKLSNKYVKYRQKFSSALNYDTNPAEQFYEELSTKSHTNPYVRLTVSCYLAIFSHTTPSSNTSALSCHVVFPDNITHAPNTKRTPNSHTHTKRVSLSLKVTINVFKSAASARKVHSLHETGDRKHFQTQNNSNTLIAT